MIWSLAFAKTVAESVFRASFLINEFNFQAERKSLSSVINPVDILPENRKQDELANGDSSRFGHPTSSSFPSINRLPDAIRFCIRTAEKMTDIAKEAAKLNGIDFTGSSNSSNDQQQSPRVNSSSTTNFEFRPSSKENGKNSKSTRSKSPGAFIERLSSFARGKCRSSLSERPTQSKNFGERPRRVLFFEDSSPLFYFHSNYYYHPSSSLSFSPVLIIIYCSYPIIQFCCNLTSDLSIQYYFEIWIITFIGYKFSCKKMCSNLPVAAVHVVFLRASVKWSDQSRYYSFA